MVAGIIEHQFAQKLAANDKPARDKAIRKLRKWLNARSTCKENVITKEELLYLWKGLFYCMWMSDKPLIQEELADVLSDLNNCFVNSDCALLFTDAFFETMHREWSGIDYLRIDKFMMLVRKFLFSCFQLLSDSNFNSQFIDKMLEVLSHHAISIEKSDAGTGLQLHVADIYVEELAKVTADKISGKDLTKFFIPYCDVLIKTATPALRKTVLDRVFRFAIRLSDDDDEQLPEEEIVNGNSHEAEEEVDDASDNDSVYSGEDLTITNSVHREWQHRIIKHEIETQKLPFPKFDYQNIGDILLEKAGKTKSLNLKQRTEIYEVVKNFHEMAGGVFPLDTVAQTKGARLKKREIDSAAKRLLEEEKEYANETLEWKQSRRHLNKKRKRGDGNDEDSYDHDSSSCESDDDFQDKESLNDAEPDQLLDVELQTDDDKITNEEANAPIVVETAPVVVDKLLQRLLSKKETVTDKKKEKRLRKKKAKPTKSFNSDSLDLGNLSVVEEHMPQDCEGKALKNSEDNDCEKGFVTSKSSRKKLKKLKTANKSGIATEELKEATINLGRIPSPLKKSNDICQSKKVNLSNEENESTLPKEVLVKKCSVVISSTDSPKKIGSNNLTSNVELSESDTKLVNGNHSLSEDNSPNGLVKDCSVIMSRNSEKIACNNVGGIQETDADILNGNTDLKNSIRKRLKFREGRISKKAKKNAEGNRYFNMALNMEDSSVSTTSSKQELKKSNPKISRTEKFASFDKFIEKPPVFFKTAVSKVTPKSKKSHINRSLVQSKSDQSGSAKKVFFKLDHNVAHEHKEYAKSVKSSPAIPFNSEVIPAQSALKLTPKTSQNFLSLNINLKKRAVAKDFFVFD